MKSKKSLVELLSMLLCIALPGCGGGGVVEVTVEQDVFAQIEGLGDAAGNESRFKEAFVDGSAPDDRTSYAKHWYQVAGDAVISDNTATVPVKVVGGAISSQESDRAAASTKTATESQTTWTLQKVGDQWKIKDAPLS